MSDMLLHAAQAGRLRMRKRTSSFTHNHAARLSFERADYLQRNYVFFWLEALLSEVERLLWWLLI